MERKNASAVVIGAGDYIGAAIAKRFAAGRLYACSPARRNGDKLAPPGGGDQAAGGTCVARSRRRAQGGGGRRLPARRRRACAARGLRLQRRRQREFSGPRNHRARVPQGVGDGLLRAASSTGREAARQMLPRGRGSIFFTGATASLRGGKGYTAFASAKVRPAVGGAEHGPRAAAAEHPRGASRHRCGRRHRMGARDAGGAARRGGREQPRAGSADGPASIAEAYWYLHQQPRDAWTFELDLRPYSEQW